MHNQDYFSFSPEDQAALGRIDIRDEAEAQRIHDEARAADPTHELISCWCCCWDCNFFFDAVTNTGQFSRG